MALALLLSLSIRPPSRSHAELRSARSRSARQADTRRAGCLAIAPEGATADKCLHVLSSFQRTDERPPSPRALADRPLHFSVTAGRSPPTVSSTVVRRTFQGYLNLPNLSTPAMLARRRPHGSADARRHELMGGIVRRWVETKKFASCRAELVRRSRPARQLGSKSSAVDPYGSSVHREPNQRGTLKPQTEYTRRLPVCQPRHYPSSGTTMRAGLAAPLKCGDRRAHDGRIRR